MDKTLYVYDTAGKEHAILLKVEPEVVGEGDWLVATDQAGHEHRFNGSNVVRWVVK